MTRLKVRLLRWIASSLTSESHWQDFFNVVVEEAQKTYYEDNAASVARYLHKQLDKSIVKTNYPWGLK